MVGGDDLVASFDISTFRAEMARSGFLPTNLFKVTITVPLGLIAAGTGSSSLLNTARVMDLYCEACPIPGVAVLTNDIRRYGYGTVEKKPFTHRMFDIAMDFRSDGIGGVHYFLSSWIRLIAPFSMERGIGTQVGAIQSQSPYELAYKADYATDVRITTYNQAGQEAIVTVLREAYPVYVADLPQSWDSNNKYQRIPAVFTFYDWYSEKAAPVTFGGNVGEGIASIDPGTVIKGSDGIPH